MSARGDAAPATVEALIRSGQPELFTHARGHLEGQLAEGMHLARLRALVAADHHPDAVAQHVFLEIALDDYIAFVAENGMAAMRALHGKRGFATVERGLASGKPLARDEGMETLLNFGPAWLAARLARRLARDSFDAAPSPGLSSKDLQAVGDHPDKRVREGARG